MTKQPITIEGLLSWTYREQLPKRGWIESLGLGNTFGDCGTKVSGGTVMVYAEMIAGGVHDDALRVEEEVNSLSGMALELDDPGILVDDMPALAADVPDALSGRTLLLHGLVARMAQLSTSPDWIIDAPRLNMVRDLRSGAPLWFVKKQVRCRAGNERWFEEREADGFDRTAQRPLPGAYRKFEWGEPGVRAVADLRYDYLAWGLALKKLSESLCGIVSKFSLEPIARVRLPWTDRDGAEARLVRPRGIVKRPQIEPRAEAAGMRAAKRLAQASKKTLTAAGT